jgi:hypothetical protein
MQRQRAINQDQEGVLDVSLLSHAIYAPRLLDDSTNLVFRRMMRVMVSYVKCPVFAVLKLALLGARIIRLLAHSHAAILTLG